jgi:hypothetical protein
LQFDAGLSSRSACDSKKVFPDSSGSTATNATLKLTDISRIEKLTWPAAVIAWRQFMVIGLPEEMKAQEYCVALPPSGAYQPARHGIPLNQRHAKR